MMHRIRCLFVITSLSIALGASLTAGSEYRDPHDGFSFQYPEGWYPVEPKAGRILENVPSQVKQWVGRNNVDLSDVSMFLVRSGSEDFLENLNVVVVPEKVALDDDSLKKQVDRLEKTFNAMGIKWGGLKSDIQKFGNHKAIVLEYHVTFPFEASRLRQRQVYFPGGGKTFIVTSTEKSEAFANHDLTFRQILHSFKVPAPDTQGFDWSRALMIGLFGGGAGGLTALLKKYNFLRPQPS